MRSFCATGHVSLHVSLIIAIFIADELINDWTLCFDFTQLFMLHEATGFPIENGFDRMPYV